jgi:hypothetical protein
MQIHVTLVPIPPGGSHPHDRHNHSSCLATGRRARPGTRSREPTATSVPGPRHPAARSNQAAVGILQVIHPHPQPEHAMKRPGFTSSVVHPAATLLFYILPAWRMAKWVAWVRWPAWVMAAAVGALTALLTAPAQAGWFWGTDPKVEAANRALERAAGKATLIPTLSAIIAAAQALSPETRTAVSPAIAKDTAVQVPPRGVEPRFSD